MPPEPEAIPLPNGYGRDAMEWLEAHGIFAIVPPIRSRCLNTLHSGGPFHYYLTRRLGLVSALYFSKCLHRGSWFHKRLELLEAPSDVVSRFLEDAINTRFHELEDMAALYHLSPNLLHRLKDNEERAARTAWAQYECAVHLPINDPNKLLAEGLYGYLTRPELKLLGSELEFSYIDPRWPKTPLQGRLDRLYLDTKRNLLWPFDLKTSTKPTTSRLQSVPLNFQTIHYLIGTEALIESGHYRKMFDLAADTKLGGMIHAAIQTPTIEFSGLDRDYREYEKVLKSGPNRGEVRMEREFVGDPKWSNYEARCLRWMQGVEEYKDLAAKREADKSPVVNLSFTFASALDSRKREEYASMVSYVYDHATRLATPDNFYRHENGYLTQGGDFNDYSPLYKEPVHQWPEIMQVNRLFCCHTTA